jgi:hypothetical protein
VQVQLGFRKTANEGGGFHAATVQVTGRGPGESRLARGREGRTRRSRGVIEQVLNLLWDCLMAQK